MVEQEELQFHEEYMNEQDPSILHFLLASGDDVLFQFNAFKILILILLIVLFTLCWYLGFMYASSSMTFRIGS